MLVISKSILVAAALVLVGFGAAGAVWAKGNRFFFPPQRYDCSGAIASPVPVASVPRSAFTEHLWVNSELVQAPMYVDSLNARLTLEEKEAEAAADARRLSLMEESRASAAKRAAAAAKAVTGSGGRPRFMFEPTHCHFGFADRRPAPLLRLPAASDRSAASGAETAAVDSGQSSISH
ncbi:MAG: hypothetical protein Q8T09_19720 [Candidatus Melainabacteria bacterium]|nr:hypothetical protein [Candidatus Melainabacteria bacterium]